MNVQTNTSSRRNTRNYIVRRKIDEKREVDLVSNSRGTQNIIRKWIDYKNPEIRIFELCPVLSLPAITAFRRKRRSIYQYKNGYNVVQGRCDY